MTPEDLAKIPRQTAEELLNGVPGGPGYESRVLFAVEAALNLADKTACMRSIDGSIWVMMRQELLDRIEAFCRAKGISERQFSELAAKAKFVSRFRKGITTQRNIEAAHSFLERHADTSGDELRQMLTDIRKPSTVRTAA